MFCYVWFFWGFWMLVIENFYGGVFLMFVMVMGFGDVNWVLDLDRVDVIK